MGRLMKGELFYEKQKEIKEGFKISAPFRIEKKQKQEVRHPDQWGWGSLGRLWRWGWCCRTGSTVGRGHAQRGRGHSSCVGQWEWSMALGLSLAGLNGPWSQWEGSGWAFMLNYSGGSLESWGEICCSMFWKPDRRGLKLFWEHWRTIDQIKLLWGRLIWSCGEVIPIDGISLISPDSIHFSVRKAAIAFLLAPLLPARLNPCWFTYCTLGWETFLKCHLTISLTSSNAFQQSPRPFPASANSPARHTNAPVPFPLSSSPGCPLTSRSSQTEALGLLSTPSRLYLGHKAVPHHPQLLLTLADFYSFFLRISSTISVLWEFTVPSVMCTPAVPSASPGILLEVQNLSPPQAHWVRNLPLTSTPGDLGEQRSSPEALLLAVWSAPSTIPRGRKVRPPGTPEDFCLLLCVLLH